MTIDGALYASFIVLDQKLKQVSLCFTFGEFLVPLDFVLDDDCQSLGEW